MTTTQPDSQLKSILSVSTLNQRVRHLLENGMRQIWVEGEISNLVKPVSGHLYFTLKDDKAQVSCALFRSHYRPQQLVLENGLKIQIRATVSLYEPRGNYQLLVDYVELAGIGALQRAFEALKNQLEKEGLFAQKHKRSLPLFPKRVGVITSITGAAIHDILKVLKRRFASAAVIIYPTLVQGKAAAPQIIRALTLAHQHNQCDVLILARGGGSLEDLWPFNEESVARALFQRKIPIISGIGHEIDFTIADFIVDERAPTPSAAAERVSPDGAHWQTRLHHHYQTVIRLQKQYLLRYQQQLNVFKHRLRHPRHTIQLQLQRLDELLLRLKQVMQQRLARQRHLLLTHLVSIKQHNPILSIRHYQQLNQYYGQQLQQFIKNCLQERQRSLSHYKQHLHTVSPLATLERGYAIVETLPQQTILRSVTQVTPASSLKVRLADGQLLCTVTEIIKPAETPS